VIDMPGRRTIGVDIGGTKVLAGVVDEGLGVHHRAQRTVTGLDLSAIIDMTVEAVREARDAAGADAAAVGFGIPALMDQRTGKAVFSAHLPLADVAFGAIMTERLALPVFVDNDGNNTALAEHRAGAAQGTSDAVILTMGTGIGGGLILGGRPYRGSVGAAPEFGHVSIEMNGPPCHSSCPNRGCLETMASGPALVREAARLARERPHSGLGRALADGQELAGPLVTELAHDGDEAAIEVITLIGHRLGIGIANYVNIFNPEVVVIGGGVIAAGELLLAPARAVVAERALPPSRDEVRIVAARFGVEAGMVGAAALAFDGLSGHGP
jgi:glucokinase